jgi:hypothetical protein
MSDFELRLVWALDRCELKPGSTDQRFCDDLSTMSRYQSQILLTEASEPISGALLTAIATASWMICQRKPREELVLETTAWKSAKTRRHVADAMALSQPQSDACSSS